jgi:hypothetical protein
LSKNYTTLINESIVKNSPLDFIFTVVLGFMACISINSQTAVSTSSHIEEIKAIEISYIKGENNYGASFSGMYYYRDNIHLKLFGGFRKLDYKSYSENILEAGAEVGYTLWEGDTRGRNQFFSFFNFTALGGFSYELVKVKSETNLIEEYPKHLYLYLGGNLEYSLSATIGVNLFFKEYYATNGSKDKLGNWRYNFGVGLRYYIFR